MTKKSNFPMIVQCRIAQCYSRMTLRSSVLRNSLVKTFSSFQKIKITFLCAQISHANRLLGMLWGQNPVVWLRHTVQEKPLAGRMPAAWRRGPHKAAKDRKCRSKDRCLTNAKLSEVAIPSLDPSVEPGHNSAIH